MMYYHGSPVSGISHFQIKWINDNPLGPGIYLSRDQKVAGYYTNGGSLYEVMLIGNPTLTIDLDSSYRAQHVEAKEIIIKCLRKFNLLTSSKNTVLVRDLIHPAFQNRMEVNQFLAKNGIWMIYGHLAPNEKSGPRDRGIQYVLINESFSTIKSETVCS